MQLEQLSRSNHAGLRIDPAQALAAAANVHLVPLVKSEMRRIALNFPIIFAKHPETGQFYPGAMLGLRPGQNLFWDGSRLDTEQIPLNLLRQPFYVGEETDGQTVILLDAANPGVGAAQGWPIVNDDGSDSDYFRHIQSLLTEMVTQRQATEDFASQLVRLNLLAPLRINIALHGGERIELEGLYGIDEAALQEHEANLLTFEDRLLAFAALLSRENMAGLVRRENERQAAAAAWHKPPSERG